MHGVLMQGGLSLIVSCLILVSPWAKFALTLEPVAAAVDSTTSGVASGGRPIVPCTAQHSIAHHTIPDQTTLLIDVCVIRLMAPPLASLQVGTLSYHAQHSTA